MKELALQQYVTLGGTFVLSILLALYLTPLVRKGALDYNILDIPGGDLKQHKAPIPYLGGIAIYLSFLITLAIVFDFTSHLVGLLLGGTMVAMLGLFDDLRVLPAILKLAMQLLVVWVVIKSDISIQLIDIPTIVAIPLSVFWLVGITNAINILDVSDGLATSVSAIAGGYLFIIALMNGNVTIAALTIALVGALIGFLQFNKEPASIYLGDTGSLFIGFMLAALGMIGSYTKTSIWGIAAPVAILFVPIFDVTLCSIARLSKGISPMHGSNDHFALRLKHRGYSAANIAKGASVISLFTGFIGLSIVFSEEGIAQYLVIGLASAFGLGLFFFLTKLPAPPLKREQ